MSSSQGETHPALSFVRAHAKLLFVVLVVAYLVVRWVSSWGHIRVGARPASGRTVVVLLHGYGAPPDDLVGLAEELSKQLPDASFLLPAGPHRVMGTGRSWLPDFSEPTLEAYKARMGHEIDAASREVWQVVDKARAKGVSCSDIYLGGFSQGGRIAAEAALRAPADCSLGGLIVLSGASLRDVSLPSPSGGAAMRVLVAHGRADGVVGFAVGRELASQLQASGHDVRWLAFDGQHGIPPVVRQAIAPFLRGEQVGEREIR